MAKKKKTAVRSSGTLARNVVWFCVSVTILIGASLLFHRIIQWPDMPLKEVFIKEGSKLASLAEPGRELPAGKEDGQAPKANPAPDNKSVAGQPQAATVNTYKYTFYDILNHPKETADQSEPTHYSIQLGAFKSHKSAQQYRDELKRAKHLDCRLYNKGEWTVVIWGNFPTKKAAERSSRQIGRVLARDCLVIGLG